MINWHRLFGLTLSDYFIDTQYRVEMEKDVSRKRQLLDILVIRGDGKPLADPCDGLEDLHAHNLVTYKSGEEALNGWAIEELIGHYVNYRKAFAPDEPDGAFALYAVATRRPEALMRQADLIPVKAGVYRLAVLTRQITVIVLKEVANSSRNALWELFSFQPEKVTRGVKDYRWRDQDHQPILEEIYDRYQQIGIAMSYSFDEFRYDLAKRLVHEYPLDDLLEDFSPEERLRGLPPEERLQGLTEEEIEELKQILERRRTQG